MTGTPVSPLRRRRAAVLPALLLLAGSSATGQVGPAPRVAVDPARLAGLAEFVDGVVAQQIATREVGGAVVTVVDHGRVLFTRGYGDADTARGTPVDPQRTLFRPGSVSKLFTWTALMQQVERGRVRLDADVNDYLDYHIPEFRGQPIRVRDLLSHSPGMSDVSGFITDRQEKVTPYQQWIKAHIPARLWPAGTEVAYSNYGAALAGYIVERVSGEAYPDYVERHIFRPLGMMSTSFREPLPPALAARMASGYKVQDARLTPKGFEYLSSIMPAGSATSSAPDMARFMMMMLRQGRLDGAQILRPDSVRLLESDSLANAPGLPGMAHGYLVYREAGPRLIGHAGNTVDFHSNLVLAPEAQLGYFVSVTGGPASYPARTELSDAITGRLFPQARAPRWSGTEVSLPVLGAYRANRRDYAKPADPANDLKVTRVDAHTILIDNEGVRTAWEQIGPHLYEQVTGARAGGPHDRLAFYGPPDDPRLSLASQPYETYHLVR